MPSPTHCRIAHATRMNHTACTRDSETYLFQFCLFMHWMARWLRYSTGMHRMWEPIRQANDHCTMAVGTVGAMEARIDEKSRGVVMVYSMFCTESLSSSRCSRVFVRICVLVQQRLHGVAEELPLFVLSHVYVSTTTSARSR